MQIKREPDSQASCTSPPSSSSPAVCVLTFPEYEIQIRRRQPACRTCNTVAVRMVTSPLNPTSAGRAYYICPSCPWACRWVCWADTEGMAACNPPCECDVPSRLDVIGQSKGAKAGRGFWTCATGTCGYYSENWDGTSGTSKD